MDQLIDHGFLGATATGAVARKATTLYALSDRWRDWGTAEFRDNPRPRHRRCNPRIGFEPGHPFHRRKQTGGQDRRPPPEERHRGFQTVRMGQPLPVVNASASCRRLTPTGITPPGRRWRPFLASIDGPRGRCSIPGYRDVSSYASVPHSLRKNRQSVAGWRRETRTSRTKIQKKRERQQVAMPAERIREAGAYTVDGDGREPTGAPWLAVSSCTAWGPVRKWQCGGCCCTEGRRRREARSSPLRRRRRTTARLSGGL